MFCPNCGKENPNDVKFCAFCGTPLTPPAGDAPVPPTDAAPAEAASASAAKAAPASDAAQASAAGTAPASAPVGNAPQQPAKKFPVIPVVIAVVVVLLLIIIISVATTRKPKISLNKYLSFETDGYDGFGTVRAVIDWEGMEKKYGKKLSFTSKEAEALKSVYGWLLGSSYTAMDYLEDSILISIDQSSGLSNNDPVTYTWYVPDNLKDIVKCKVKYYDGVYTVEGLEEIDTFDAFDGVSLQFEGSSSNGYANLLYSGEYLTSYYFSIDPINALANGDAVTVTIPDFYLDTIIEEVGMIPETMSKTFAVEGLAEYVESYSELPESFLSDLRSEAEDSIFSYVAERYSTGSSLSGLTYVGYIFETLKEDAYSTYENKLYLIYKGNASNASGNFDATDVYYPVYFTDIQKTGSDYSYGALKGIPGNSYLRGRWRYTTKGYVNPYTCYMELVEADSDYYTAECGDGFTGYETYSLIAGLSDISDSYKQTLYEIAEEELLNYIDENYPYTISYSFGSKGNNTDDISDPVYYGELLLLNKSQGTNFEDNNIYIVIFEATLTSSYGDFEPVTVYFPVEFDGIVSLPNGEFMYYTDAGILGTYELPNRTWQTTKGYLYPEEVYEDLITANRDSYTWDATDSVEALAFGGAEDADTEDADASEEE